MKIAILGTRGIPNHYGGFEQVAEWLSAGLADKGHEVTVYNSHRHPWQQQQWGQVKLVHCYDPEKTLGTAGQFVYDLNCILDARKKSFDVLLFMGYTSSSVWSFLFPRNALVVTNMDGLEWKRSKYSGPVQLFLKRAEKLAVKFSHYHIADSIGIQDYHRQKYGIECHYIPYAPVVPPAEDPSILKQLDLEPRGYHMLIARMEPENQVETILSAFTEAECHQQLLIVGNTNNRYGRMLTGKYGKHPKVCFAGPLFEQAALQALRRNCQLYFHGHSVGGTNPSLLEAMASSCCIVAHDNVFNKGILGADAFYFKNEKDLIKLLNMGLAPDTSERMRLNNTCKIEEFYQTGMIVEQYHHLLTECFSKKTHEKLVRPRRYAFK